MRMLMRNLTRQVSSDLQNTSLVEAVRARPVSLCCGSPCCCYLDPALTASDFVKRSDPVISVAPCSVAAATQHAQSQEAERMEMRRASALAAAAVAAPTLLSLHLGLPSPSVDSEGCAPTGRAQPTGMPSQ